MKLAYDTVVGHPTSNAKKGVNQENLQTPVQFINFLNGEKKQCAAER